MRLRKDLLTAALACARIVKRRGPDGQVRRAIFSTLNVTDDVYERMMSMGHEDLLREMDRDRGAANSLVWCLADRTRRGGGSERRKTRGAEADERWERIKAARRRPLVRVLACSPFLPDPDRDSRRSLLAFGANEIGGLVRAKRVVPCWSKAMLFETARLNTGERETTAIEHIAYRRLIPREEDATTAAAVAASAEDRKASLGLVAEYAVAGRESDSELPMPHTVLTCLQRCLRNVVPNRMVELLDIVDPLPLTVLFRAWMERRPVAEAAAVCRREFD